MNRNTMTLARRLGLAIVLLLAAASASAADKSTPAPDFTLKSSTGANVKLSELRGQVVMINFWASWCGPCRQEMPLLDKLYHRYKGLGFTLLGVNVEPNSSDAQKLLKDIPVSFPILFDTSNKVTKLYGVAAMPSTAVVDRDGKVRFLHQGYVPGDEAEYEKQVRALLRE